MKYHSIILVLISVCFFNCNAQKTTEQDNDNFLSEVHRVCPKAEVISVEQKMESIEVDFTCDGKPMSMVFDKQGTLLYKESPYNASNQFKQKIDKKIQKTHAGWLLDEMSLIETKDTSFVKLEMIKNGVEESLFFTLDGKFYKVNKAQNNETWSAQTLEDNSYYQTLPYNFSKPSKQFDLSEVLKEISGITLVNDSVAFCVQDELGAVFQINLNNEIISTVARFTDIGDFEDIQVVGNMVTILRSDGVLFTFDYNNFSGKTSEIRIQVPCMNIEGLWFDQMSKQYLISCKEPSVSVRSATKKEHKQRIQENAEKERFVYSFSLNSANKPKEHLAIAIAEIRSFIKEHYQIDSVQNITFNPSALAIHPKTKDMYVLSATDRLIAVYSGKTLINVMLLPPELFYKPEGVEFLSNGDMVICSEGMKKGYVQGQITILKMKD
ncbi:MAG: hypothetical protein MJ197_01145 [Bacteroidales bacterium]|nr:hypothetical protein [Bacteroidales bacterium]